MLCKKNVVIPYPTDRAAPVRTIYKVLSEVRIAANSAFASPISTIHVLAYAIDEDQSVPSAASRRTFRVPEITTEACVIIDCTSTLSSGTIFTGTFEATKFAIICHEIVAFEQLIIVEVVCECTT